MNLWKKLDIYLLKVSNAIGSNISTEIIRTIKLITIKILSVDKFKRYVNIKIYNKNKSVCKNEYACGFVFLL